MEKKDPSVPYNEPSELKIAAEFLTTWLPFLTKTLCHRCTQSLSNRVRSLDPGFVRENQSPPLPLKEIHCDCDMKDTNSLGSWKDSSIDNSQLVAIDNCEDTNSLGSWKDGANGNSNNAVIDDCDVSEDGNSLGSWKESPSGYSQAAASNNACVQDDSASDSHRLSWADMAQEEEHDDDDEDDDDLVEEEPQSKQTYKERRKIQKKNGETLSREQREYLRYKIVQRTKDFNCMRWIDGRRVNILEGLELHTGVFSAAEQKRIVGFIYDLEEKGKRGELQERTYSAPEKWMPGKGRVTLQFGCCYNYAVLKDGSPPGIIRNKPVDPLPHLFKVMIRRLVAWHVLPPTCVPDSCIVNIYEEGDCIPPHIDHHDFVRPFCTVSFLSECNILFGAKLKIVGPGDFSGDVAIPLPLGSVLVLNGNGADVAKHCVPGVPTKRISITFRKMDKSKHPIGYVPELDLQGIQPLPYDVDHSEGTDTPKLPTPLYRHRVSREVGSEMGRGFSSRGSMSEPRYSRPVGFAPRSDWKGLLRRPDDVNESNTMDPTNLTPQTRRERVGREVDSETREFAGRGGRSVGWSQRSRLRVSLRS
ncbi:Rna demethylase alkbh9b [Thalictrum thalictroides]|uniref:Rna demethylase alkbh9b n=1 Tax=Thalictrum thalictroides TaxID=46969 RepID=A0A7J6WY49_THATH|nr:Rna demethylase alkbh9b [Thalictrum thalictroides]